MEQIRRCPVHPGKAAFLPLERTEVGLGKCRSPDSLRSLGMTVNVRQAKGSDSCGV
jgi:hypothetical protein